MVARDGRFVYAQVIGDVVEFLGLKESTAPQLAPDALAERADLVLATGIRLAHQMPDALLGNLLPHRPRSWRVLIHHIFQIFNAFLEMEETAAVLRYEMLVAEPPQGMQSSAALARFGADVRARFAAWWQRVRNESFARQVSTYFGETSRHEMLERTVWHAAQHVRQLAALLEQAGLKPDHPLTASDLRGLPLTDKIWDD